ncbi:hypothetical protein KSS87_008973 [Heliosperma pusillum]|nr:hypothetical protein KSS87_008973 [Heliosperma pusillum]
MSKFRSSSVVLLLIFVLLVTLISKCQGSIYHGYYIGKCGKYNVEEIVYNVVKTHLQRDPDTVSDLIRLQFHDCFVRGCDGSVLLDGEMTEKTAEINVGLSGFRAVDDAKEAVEKVCPGVVSCADVLTVAARSAVFMAGGKWYSVETGRRDSLVSHRREAIAEIPKPDISVDSAIQLFASKGLSKEDFVYLMVGTAHCDKFRNRLYNFHNTGDRDKRIQPLNFLHFLKRTCPRNNQVDNQAFLDQTPKSEFKIDNGYYNQILHSKGILEIDDNLAFSPLTNGIVKFLAYTPNAFHDRFGPAMVKMGRINVLTGNQDSSVHTTVVSKFGVGHGGGGGHAGGGGHSGSRGVGGLDEGGGRGRGNTLPILGGAGAAAAASRGRGGSNHSRGSAVPNAHLRLLTLLVSLALGSCLICF